MNALRISALLPITFALGAAVAQSTPAATYQQMAPLNQYLIGDRQAEITLARSAAPPAISLHATVLVLTPHGYETAAQGTNGFTCEVERSWTKPFDDPQFWNWHGRAPVCFNSAASRTVLPYVLFRTRMVLAGVSKSQMLDRVTAAVAGKQLPTPEPGAMAYMMSKDQYLTDIDTANGVTSVSWYSHVMFYAPKVYGENAGASWGADRLGSPVVYDSSNRIQPEPWAVFFVPVDHWSDGTKAPSM